MAQPLSGPPVGMKTHTPHHVQGDVNPGYRSNLEEMGEKQSENMDIARISG